MKNEVVLRAGDTINEFGWDNKHAGINVLISKVLKPNKSSFHFLIISLLLLNHCATNFIDYLNIIYCCLNLCFYSFWLYVLVWNVATISLIVALVQNRWYGLCITCSGIKSKRRNSNRISPHPFHLDPPNPQPCPFNQ